MTTLLAVFASVCGASAIAAPSTAATGPAPATGPAREACNSATAVNLGYLANVGDGDISVVDLTTDRIVGSLKGFNQPWNVNITPDGRTLYVDDMPAFTPSKTAIAVVDTCAGKITRRMPTGGLAIGSMPADGRELFTAKYFRNEVEVLDTADASVKASYRTEALPLATLSDEDGTEIWVRPSARTPSPNSCP